MNQAIAAVVTREPLKKLVADLIKFNGFSDQNFYGRNVSAAGHQVYNMSCRTCHATRAAGFSRDPSIAGGTLEMPQALRTWANFWSSGSANSLKTSQNNPNLVPAYNLDQPGTVNINTMYTQ
jgi:hypothetical protein